MNKLLSICVPSYNMEKYISRNLDSFLQSDQVEALELIVVNDGSTDKTLKIINGYKEKYPKIIKVIDKPNGHYGSCVNAALAVATGKYFRIVDADDWVNSDSLTELVNILRDIQTDVVYTRYSNYHESRGEYELNEDPAKNLIWRKVLNVNEVAFDKYVHMHQITYRTDFLHAINYTQTEGVCYTDTEYVYMPMIQARDIYFLNVSLYQYFIGRDDQSMSPNVLMKNFNHLHKVLTSIVSYPKPHYINKQYCFLKEYYINTLMGMLVDCIYADQCRNKDWSRKLHQIYKEVSNANIDISRFLTFNIKGCYWFKWWLEDSFFSRMKLRLLFRFINMKH